MKEREIRQGIKDFIQEFDRRLGQAVKKVMLPATLGVGLALAPGCTPEDDPGKTRPAATRPAKADTADAGMMVALYAAPFPADAGVPNPQPEYAAPFPADAGGAVALYAAPFPTPDSCEGFCDEQAPAGCWCDDQCKDYNDCCDDKAAVCDADAGGPVALYAAPFPADAGTPDPASCEGFCDEQAPSGCWCDDQCKDYNDCCDDKAAVCDADAGGGPVALYAAPFPADAGVS